MAKPSVEIYATWDELEELRQHLFNNNKVKGIKRARELYGLSLRAAKLWSDEEFQCPFITGEGETLIEQDEQEYLMDEMMRTLDRLVELRVRLHELAKEG